MRKPFEPFNFMVSGVPSQDIVTTKEANAAIAQDKAEWEALRAQLAEAEEVVEFYAKKETWECDDTSRATGNKTYDVCLFDFDRSLEPKKDYAGKKARAYLTKHRADGKGEG